MFLSICTPTYNRAYTLSRTYESLISQTNKDFEWVIVDDGSTDNTKALIDKWLDDNLIKIIYFYQENQGKHVALNKGASLSSGTLFTCLDSDDWFYRDTVEIVNNTWNKIKNSGEVAGIIGLDTFENGEVVGTKFPRQLESENWINLIYNHKVKGDKAYFYVLDILEKYPFPNINNNKHMPPSYQLYLISERYKMRLLNKPLKYVEYLPDGITNNIPLKYMDSPDNYAYYRSIIMNLIPNNSRKIINAIHLNSSLIMAKHKYGVKGFKNKVIFYLTKPLGILLFLYLKTKYKKVNNK